ncbi:SDR family NAD(P)-dependent oxidoreductase [Aurantibacter crassamenti]|uniref:SDR family NAD(P)-dependent oxidoreductase n=1 Tax=Aurantibacter crassamenti TaxID=1837375 RepID=UPI001939AE05|nr:SDR family NAD(P)-dependent oxidoreductase [Aurantibacter crassamenti]MBM1107812.1 SDR family NAD(P)-dependent oxidoreductase [Aurantibacter crassamenti]
MKKTILITGASSGFGLLSANLLYEKGHKVYGTSRSPARYQTPFELLEMDVQDLGSIQNVVSHIITEQGQIDVLINNAGMLLYGALEEASEKEVQRIYDVNVFGAMRVANEVLPQMRKSRKGKIINVTSLAGLVETPTFGHYCATKHALEGYTKTLSHEVAPFGIQVALVKPGEYYTNIFENAVFSENKIADYEFLREILNEQVEARISAEDNNSQEVAQLITKLVEVKQMKLHNRIGKFSGMIPMLNLFPGMLKKVVKKTYGLDKV